MISSNKAQMISVKLAMSCFAALAVFKPALASPNIDYFATRTKLQPQLKISQPATRKVEASTQVAPTMGPLAMMSVPTPIVTWFESFDKAVSTFKPSQADRVILTRPLNQKAERVEQWIQVARKISKNYRLCAQTLKKMQIPENAPGLKDYRDLTADWYTDVATVYADLIRPRPPVKTMEELEDQLNEVKGRSQSLAKTTSSLKAMDLNLRKQFKVHMSIEEDALQQYVRGK